MLPYVVGELQTWQQFFPTCAMPRLSKKTLSNVDGSE